MKFTSFTKKSANLVLVAFLTLIMVNCNQPKEEVTPFDIEKVKSEIRSRLNLYEGLMVKGDKDALGEYVCRKRRDFSRR